MRILTRYILKEVLSYAFLGGVLFTFVLVMPNLPNLMELIVRNSASMGVIAKIFLLMLPNMFTVTIPMAVLSWNLVEKPALQLVKRGRLATNVPNVVTAAAATSAASTQRD